MIKMSEEQKYKAGSYMTIAYRAFIGISMAILLRSIPIFIYDVAQWKADIEERTLSSVEMRIDLERHMKIWSVENQANAFGRLGATETAVIELKKADSLAQIDRTEMREVLEQIEINTRN